MAKLQRKALQAAYSMQKSRCSSSRACLGCKRANHRTTNEVTKGILCCISNELAIHMVSHIGMQKVLPLAGFIKLVLHFRDMCLILRAKVGARESLLSVAIGSSLGVWSLLHSFCLHTRKTVRLGMTEHEQLACDPGAMQCTYHVTWKEACLLSTRGCFSVQ